MIDLKLTNNQAIQLDALLQSLSMLTSKDLPDSARQKLIFGFTDSLDLKVVAEKLRAELNNLVQIQKEKVEKWAIDEDLKPLDIQSPPDWNGYDEYLLNGGQLEYSEWKEQNRVDLSPQPNSQPDGWWDESNF